MNIRNFSHWLLSPPTTGPRSIILIRLMIGAVFVWEGLGKFYFASLGTGRFTLIGLPMPAAMSVAIALLEIIGGVALISGLLTRVFAVLFIGEMIGVLITTKIALFFGQSPLPLPPVPPQFGLWAVLHESRSDYAQLMTALFLLFAGPGPLSLEAVLGARRQQNAGMTVMNRGAVANLRTLVIAVAFIALLPSAAVSNEYKRAKAASGPKVAWIAMYLNAKSTDPRLVKLRGYTPAQVEVHVGDHIVFTNIDDEVHTATLRLADGFPATAIKATGHNISDAWSTGDVKPDGESSPILADKPGTYTYGCIHHGADGQLGSIVVDP